MSAEYDKEFHVLTIECDICSERDFFCGNIDIAMDEAVGEGWSCFVDENDPTPLDVNNMKNICPECQKETEALKN